MVPWTLVIAVLLLGCATTGTPVRVDGARADVDRFKADQDECERQYDTQNRPSRMTYAESAVWLGRVSQGMACMSERGWKYGERR